VADEFSQGFSQQFQMRCVFCVNCVILSPFFQVLKYCSSSAINLANLGGSSWGVGSHALNWRSPASARLRACVEAVLIWQLVEAQCSSLEQNKLNSIYAGTIDKCVTCLSITLKFFGAGTFLIRDIFGLIF
jgi:hypothetical protein